MGDNRFTFAVQRLPAGPSYAESFQDQTSTRSNSRVGGQIKRIGPDIIEDLLRGKKNPVQCLNEYCSMTKKTIVYTETGSGYRYANYATIDDVQFPQGTGRSKKEAKIAGARRAFAALLDLDEEAFDTKFAGMSDVKIDRHGHKIVENGSNNPEHLYTPANVDELTHKLNLLATDHELLKSKGVANALQRVNTERALSRASTINNSYPIVNNNNELPMTMYGRESVLSGRPPSSINQYLTSTPISSFGGTSGLNTQIENPITNLQEYCKANMLPIDIKTEVCEPDPKNPDQRKLYRSWVILDNDETKISDVYAYTAIDARRRASQRALEALMKKQPSHIITSKPMVALTEYEEISNTVADFIKHNRANDHSDMFDTIHNRFYAAFVVKRTQRDVGRVVAFGMGSRCPEPENVSEMGESLLDCHALALARRAFIQYLYGELINYANGSAIRSILETSEKDSTKTQLKNHVSIHLLISGAPTGDGREFLPADCDGPMAPYDLVQMRAAGHAPIYEHPEHGHLRYKLSVGMETIDADPLQRFAIMSCSDKILKWNVLGVQGALLSNLIEPIKLSSITFLSGFKQSHTSRAVCCRLEKATDPVRVHHPMIGRVKYPLVQPQEFDSDYSYVWSTSFQGEVIDARCGRPVTGGTSLLSKVVLLSEYRHVCQRLKIQSVTSDTSYYNLKQIAKEYQQKKRAMISYLEQKKFGYWSFEKKHLEQFRWQSTIPPIQRNITM
ncbi:unnamed protein product [Rotaria sp. Silwood2]|nr:unnamed protein product [Rotaria sp. Silwood2]CAF2507873.1 unnamed protein product [Rotaria sp. Silwood2]CAF2907588.1 unnamed protein product [Rotaria sp. Silwood2]CAF4065544.1 unnamed protein product [Rotaria sp. Silwood2]CAF4301166.1 unnamed protein product [Rotaria sp. Silwood2]